MSRAQTLPTIVYVLAAGCAPPPAPYEPGRVSRFAEYVTDSDWEIIETVALSLIGDAEFRPNVSKSDLFDSIVIGDRTLRVPHLGQLRSDLRRAPAQDIQTDIVDSLIKRNPGGVALDDFKGKNVFILIESVATESWGRQRERAHPTGQKPKGLIEVSLPGYARDGNSAILRIHYHWCPSHSASGPFFLTRSSTEWVLRWRCFALYA